jgi:hypothetical protein
MLPYSPLHHLLLADAGAPLVMTSGNLSDEPIAYDDADALARLGAIADVLLVHDRRLALYTAGHVATVLGGHYHRFETSLTAGTRHLETGTVGAAGPDGLRAAGDVASEAEVLYFDRATRRPVAVDRITVRSLEGFFSVDRELLGEGETAFEPQPVQVPAEKTPRPGDPSEVVETPTPAPADGVGRGGGTPAP